MVVIEILPIIPFVIAGISLINKIMLRRNAIKVSFVWNTARSLTNNFTRRFTIDEVYESIKGQRKKMFSVPFLTKRQVSIICYSICKYNLLGECEFDSTFFDRHPLCICDHHMDHLPKTT